MPDPLKFYFFQYIHVIVGLAAVLNAFSVFDCAGSLLVLFTRLELLGLNVLSFNADWLVEWIVVRDQLELYLTQTPT